MFLLILTSHMFCLLTVAEVSDISQEETSGIAPLFTIKPTFQAVDETDTATFTATVEAVPEPKVGRLVDVTSWR